jgi:hypothetical protein
MTLESCSFATVSSSTKPSVRKQFLPSLDQTEPSFTVFLSTGEDSFGGDPDGAGASSGAVRTPPSAPVRLPPPERTTASSLARAAAAADSSSTGQAQLLQRGCLIQGARRPPPWRAWRLRPPRLLQSTRRLRPATPPRRCASLLVALPGCMLSPPRCPHRRPLYTSPTGPPPAPAPRPTLRAR